MHPKERVLCFEWLKYLVPLLSVGFGAWLALYIEAKKARAESKKALAMFYAEIQDYLKDSPEYVRNFHSGYLKVKKIEVGQIKDEDLFPLNLAPKIEFLSISNLIEKAFLQLTPDQRRAVKALISLSRAINERTDDLSKGRDISYFRDNKSKLWSAAKMSASFYYVISRLHHEKERFVFNDESNDERCKKALDALRLSAEFKELLQENG
jgi:hypothetical protein